MDISAVSTLANSNNTSAAADKLKELGAEVEEFDESPAIYTEQPKIIV